MSPPIENYSEMPKRIILGLIGLGSLAAALGMVYAFLITLKFGITELISINWIQGWNDWIQMLSGLWDLHQIGLVFAMVILGLFSVFIVPLLLFLYISLAYRFFHFAIPVLESTISRSPDMHFAKTEISSFLRNLLPFLIIVAIMFFADYYMNSNPHLGSFTHRDDYVVSIQNIMSTDKIYDCEAGSGWKFVTLHYYLNNTGTEPIHIMPLRLEDDNGISYNDYESECLTDEDFDYSKEIPANDFKIGDFVYKLPSNAIPAEVVVSVKWDFLTVSLHKRKYFLT